MAHNKMPRNKNFEKRKDLEKEQKKKNEARLKNYHEVKREENTKKFQRRILEDNWAKYDEDGEQSQSHSFTGVNFETLLAQSGKDVSTFRFNEEKTMESLGHQSREDKKMALLAFNLENTSSYLKSVPIFLKLNLQTMVNILDEDYSKWHGELIERLKNGNELAENISIMRNDDVSRDLKWDLNGVTEYKENLTLLAKKLNQVSKGSEGNVEEQPKEKSKKMGGCGDYMISNKNYVCLHDSQVRIEKQLENIEDGALESLLQMEKVKLEESFLPAPFSTTDSNCAKEDKKDNLLGDLDDNGKKDKDLRRMDGNFAKLEEKPDSLEDWLDSILE